mmetsp:Transcript_16308/g.37735  ORF Transcript_16308/g.37735 Transcript_16308/m.37735 type:complete len:296 (+) Transcript_16308:1058-1945(+)
MALGLAQNHPIPRTIILHHEPTATVMLGDHIKSGCHQALGQPRGQLRGCLVVSVLRQERVINALCSTVPFDKLIEDSVARVILEPCAVRSDRFGVHSGSNQDIRPPRQGRMLSKNTGVIVSINRLRWKRPHQRLSRIDINRPLGRTNQDLPYKETECDDGTVRDDQSLHTGFYHRTDNVMLASNVARCFRQQQVVQIPKDCGNRQERDQTSVAVEIYTTQKVQGLCDRPFHIHHPSIFVIVVDGSLQPVWESDGNNDILDEGIDLLRLSAHLSIGYPQCGCSEQIVSPRAVGRFV